MKTLTFSFHAISRAVLDAACEGIQERFDVQAEVNYTKSLNAGTLKVKSESEQELQNVRTWIGGHAAWCTIFTPTK